VHGDFAAHAPRVKELIFKIVYQALEEVAPNGIGKIADIYDVVGDLVAVQAHKLFGAFFRRRNAGHPGYSVSVEYQLVKIIYASDDDISRVNASGEQYDACFHGSFLPGYGTVAGHAAVPHKQVYYGTGLWEGQCRCMSRKRRFTIRRIRYIINK